MVNLVSFLINYKFPLWLATKPFFLMLLLIISGKQSVASNVVDVYLENLFDDITELWKLIEALIFNGYRFNPIHLKSSLLFMIHDLVVYGTLIGLNVHRYHGCLDCIFKGFMRHSSSLCKYIYCGCHTYLRMDHPYHQQKSCFNGQEENREATLAITSEYIIENEKRGM